MKLRPVTYKMKNPADYPNELLEARFRDVPGNGPFVGEYERPADDENTYDGLIAQEVEETLLDIGKTASDLGALSKEDDSPMGLGYSELISPLIKAVQELTAKNDALEARIKTLEG